MHGTDANAESADDQTKIVLVFITFNRLAYTKLSLPRLLQDSDERFELVIWDNGSLDGTPDYLKSVRDERLAELVLRPVNEGQAPATNYVWTQSDAHLCGKVDNDCLVTPGWTRVLAAAHRDIPELGGVGCWHFPPQDFDADMARHKFRDFGPHRIVVHPYIGGSAFLTKRADFARFGPIDPTWLQTDYWFRLAVNGRVNGWYHPLIFQEHMDDPRSLYCLLPECFTSDASFASRAHGFRTRRELRDWLRDDARRILRSPADVKYHMGWRRIPQDLAHRLARRTRRVFSRR